LPEVGEGAAILLEPRDAEGWAAALGRIIDDGSLRADLTRRGLERAREYTWADAAGKLLAVYRSLGAA
jgi:glycosyltransferase involved in cell wall biosynthesis